MSLRKTIFAICLVSSAFCLISGYILSGQWIGAVIVLICNSIWLLARKYAAYWLAHFCLLGSVCLAVVGILTGSPPFLMIIGLGLALAVWDLFFLVVALDSNSSGEQTRQYENKHIQSLAIALGAGLLLVLLARLIHFQTSFIILALLILLVIFGLSRVWGYIKKRGENK